MVSPKGVIGVHEISGFLQSVSSAPVLVHGPKRVATPIDNSYVLVFDEEFNGNSVDTTVWDIVDNAAPLSQDSNQLAANNLVQNGFLRQQVTAMPSGGKNWSGAQIFQWTDKKFPNGWIGGYFETRCKAPGPTSPTLTTRGADASVWMNHLDVFPENDLSGFNGGNGKAIQATYTNPDLTSDFGFNTGYQSFDPSAAFHVYGMLWTMSDVTFYIDGVQTGHFVNGQTYNIIGLGQSFTYTVDTTVPQYLIVWNTITLNASGTPDSNSIFPYNFYVDYIHIYQQGGNPVTPQPGYGGPGDAVGSGNVPGF